MPFSFLLSLSSPLSYDSSGASKDEIKERFAQTMEFVEEYLRDVVCQRFPFSDKEKNKLTFEVRRGEMVCEVLFTVVIFLWSKEKLSQSSATVSQCCGFETQKEFGSDLLRTK